MMRACVLLSLLVGAAALNSDSEANPIRKIVTLLQDMSAEIAAEGEKEQELYDKYMCYCETTAADLAKAAEGSKAKAADLASKLEEETAEKTGLDQELAEHKADRESAKKDLAEATAIREKEAAAFAAQDASEETNLNALSGALPALEKGMGASALVQLPGNPAAALKRVVNGMPSLSQYDRTTVLSFLEEGGDYAPQSGQIVGILKTMKDDMEVSLKEGRDEEAKSVAGFADLKASKSQEVQAASEAIETKTARSGELAVSTVTSANSLEDANAETAETEKYAAELKTSCAAQTKAWGVRKAGRAEEVSAISEAIGILNDDDALDVFKKAVPSAAALTQVGFLQAKHAKASKAARAQAILTNLHTTYRSPQLALLSYTARKALKQAQPAGLGMMDQMIDQMVALLGKEGEDDAKQKDYCDTELAKAEEDKKAATDSGEQIASSIEETTDGIKTLTDDIETLVMEIKAMDGSVAQATLQRKQEHEEFTKSQALDQAAVQLLEKASNRLNKFYNPVLYKEEPKKELSQEDKMYVSAGREEFASAPALVQVRAHKKAVSKAVPPPPPATFDAYTKKSEKSTGVLALMEMMLTELKQDSKNAEYEEQDAQKEYESLMADSAATRAQNGKSITDKEAAKAALEGKLAEGKKSKGLNDRELYNVNVVTADLHSSCDFILNNFDLRKEARTSESESLKNAKAVLHGMK